MRQGPVWPVVVVELDEGVEQGLQFGEGRRLDGLSP
jgi:hypothetical protein